jgi:hypothetical protein
MACGPAFGIGIDDLAAGEHAGQKRLASRRPFRHPVVRIPYGFFQIVNAPCRAIAGLEPKGDLLMAERAGFTACRCKLAFACGEAAPIFRSAVATVCAGCFRYASKRFGL